MDVYVALKNSVSSDKQDEQLKTFKKKKKAVNRFLKWKAHHLIPHLSAL